MSLEPSTVRFVDVAFPVEESTARSLPAKAVVAMYPEGVVAVTL
jgi:hypothetical protein